MKQLLIIQPILYYRKVFLLVCFYLCLGVAYGQVTVTGTVKDADNEALIGATVLESGTSNGSVTDTEGRFTLTIADGTATLTVSYVGYSTKIVPVEGNAQLDIVLSLDEETLSEVVIVGYGTQKRSDLTGSIVSADAKKITERGTTNAVQALQGSVAGVNITNQTGRVGDSFSFNIRGKSSLSGDNRPLFVVDGVITDNIDFLNPNDIASIDILKDASSQAIYGSRGSNGVVFVKTKGGVNIPGGTSISFDTYVGVKQASRLPEMMSPEKWRYYHTSAYLATINPSSVNSPEEYLNVVLPERNNSLLRQRFDNLQGFDWYDAVLKSGVQSNNMITINHRDGNSSYSLGIGYQKETGNIENEELDKYTVRLSLDQEINRKLKAGANVNLAQNVIERGSEIAMREAFRLNPFLRPFAVDANGNDIAGTLFPQPGKLTDPNGNPVVDKTSTFNPLLEIANSTNETSQYNLIGATYLQYQPVDLLSFRTSLSFGYQNSETGIAYGALTDLGNRTGGQPLSSLESLETFNYTWDNQINITKSVGQHDFNGLLLHSVFVDRSEQSFLSSTNQPFDTDFYNVGSGNPETFQISNAFTKSQLLSFAARLNYTFNDRYLITLSSRWDGSSLLAEGRRWKAFPSVALAWNIGEEAFLGGIQSVNNLKLRVGYGTVGNNSVSPYSSVSTLDQQTYYDFAGQIANGWIPASLANRQLTWEITTEANVGVDFGLFNYRLTGSVDFYNRLTDGQLLEQNLPLESGFATITANAGEVRNKGVEIMLNTVNVKKNDLIWETSFVFSKNTNSIESIYGEKIDDVGNGWFIGESIDAHYNYRFNGIWQADEAAEAASYDQTEGQAKVLDVNNDGQITPDDDRMILGSSDPSWTGGLTSSVTYKNFDFTVAVYTSQNVLVFSPFHDNFEDVRDRGRQKLDIADWYIPENEYGVAPQVSNRYPQPRNAGTFWRNNNVGFYKDADYVKIQNISLGYSLPGKVLERFALQSARVYINVLNPFVFTDYTGYDPEWASGALGISRVSNTITQLGLNVKL